MKSYHVIQECSINQLKNVGVMHSPLNKIRILYKFLLFCFYMVNMNIADIAT